MTQKDTEITNNEVDLSLATDVSYYTAVRQDILDGIFPAGSALYESAMAARYGVSRTPIREALSLLEHDGLLIRAPRGYRICAGTPQDILEIYEARIALESAATSAAATRGTRLDLMKLEHLATRDKETTDIAERRRTHTEWHECLWQAGHNFVIQSTLTRLMTQLKIYDHTLPEPTDDLDVSDDEHAKIMAAIQINDAAAAGELMAEHLRRSRDLRLQTLVLADI